MLEIEYIPLKSLSGELLGHACLRAGQAKTQLKRAEDCSVLILTETGSAAGNPGGRIPFSGEAQAVALHKNGALRGWGVSRCSGIRPEELRRRVQSLAPSPVAPAAPAAPQKSEPLPEKLVDEIVEGLPDFSPDTAVYAALKRLGAEVEPPKAPNMPAEPLAEQPEDQPDEAACRAMKARAAQVLKRIATPVTEPVEAGEPYTVPAASAAGWTEEADALLERTSEPETIPNPFPHIFPGAAFTRAPGGDALEGVWQHGNSRAEISAVPGAYSPQPPASLAGYTRYIRARSGGYWVRVTE